MFIFLSSCSIYLDSPHENEIRSENLDFTCLNHYNEFVYKSKINGKADGQIFYITNFSVRLPKKIKSWQQSGNAFFFEYDDKEIIYIDSGYKKQKDAGEWILNETDDDQVYNRLSSYWYKRKYRENNLKANQLGRLSRVYSDGKVTILLYNIKSRNFEKYLSLVKNFKYLN